MEFLKSHPFAVQAHFDESIVLTYALPKEDLENLIPPCLQLDTFQDKWAFLAIAMVRTKNLRPKGFPKLLGNKFMLIGYRIFVRYTTNHGKKLRGLYILKSETDKKKMELLGNIFTHYNYSTTDISYSKDQQNAHISSQKSDFSLTYEWDSVNEIHLPTNSPFNDWKEARRFAGPLPFTFTFNKKTSEILIIEGKRENWTPTPLKVINHNFSFMDSLFGVNPVLANAFIIKNIPYEWKKGRKELWKS